MAGAAQAINVADILEEIPERLYQTIDRAVAVTPDHPALFDGSVTWSYRQFSDLVRQITSTLQGFGVRLGDRIMIVSENFITLAGLLLAARRINAWAIVANPRLSPRELDQISDHSGSRRMFYRAESLRGT